MVVRERTDQITVDHGLETPVFLRSGFCRGIILTSQPGLDIQLGPDPQSVLRQVVDTFGGIKDVRIIVEPSG